MGRRTITDHDPYPRKLRWDHPLSGRDGDRGHRLYLVLHSATVRNPRARWEFPKGGMEADETTRDTAGREFCEETGLVDWSFRPGFERSLSYTYIRRGRKVLKTVTYYVAEVHGTPELVQSIEHVEDGLGRWFRWGPSARPVACSTTPRSARSSRRPNPGSTRRPASCFEPPRPDPPDQKMARLSPDLAHFGQKWRKFLMS